MATKKRVRDLPQIALYVKPGLKRKIAREASARRRGLGPTVIEILEAHFDENDKKEAKQE